MVKHYVLMTVFYVSSFTKTFGREKILMASSTSTSLLSSASFLVLSLRVSVLMGRLAICRVKSSCAESKVVVSSAATMFEEVR